MNHRNSIHTTIGKFTIDLASDGSNDEIHRIPNIHLCSIDYRNYALRRIRDAFRANKGLTASDEVKKQYQFAIENLNIIRRQVKH